MLFRRQPLFDPLCGPCCSEPIFDKANCSIPAAAAASVDAPITGPATGVFTPPVYQNNAQPGNTSPAIPNPPAAAGGLISCKAATATQAAPAPQISLVAAAAQRPGAPVGTTLAGSGPCCGNVKPSSSLKAGINAITGMKIFAVPAAATLTDGRVSTVSRQGSLPIAAVGVIPPSAGCVGIPSVASAPKNHWTAIALVVGLIFLLWFVAGALTGRKLQ